MIPWSLRTILFWLMTILLLVGSVCVHWRFGNEGVGVFGSYASVLGLIVTFYVAESVRKVRDRYTIRGTHTQLFERFQHTIQEFNKTKKAAEYQLIAGTLLPLIKELSVHLPSEESIQSLLSGLQKFMSCEARLAKSMKAGIASELQSFKSLIEIQRSKAEWRRDDA